MRIEASSNDGHTATRSWQALLRAAIRTRQELLSYLELSPSQVSELSPADTEFPLLVPMGFAARMRKRDPHDPLLRQVLPITSELDAVAGFREDPLEELASAHAGVLRKYPSRALLITTAACPVHCRYCFRRHFPYGEQLASRNDWFAELRDAQDVTEIILSGGDPLSLSNERLSALIDQIESLPQVDTLRIHSRFPVVLPERIDRGLLGLLERTQLDVVMVTHCNHAQEIDEAVADALGALRRTGATLLNQSVLLGGVNDDAAVLAALSRRLFAAGVLPYYLHELDAVSGAAHFRVARESAVALVEELRRSLPGYLVPRLVREIPGELSKTVVA